MRCRTGGAGSGVRGLEGGRGRPGLRILDIPAPPGAAEELRTEWGPRLAQARGRGRGERGALRGLGERWPWRWQQVRWWSRLGARGAVCGDQTAAQWADAVSVAPHGGSRSKGGPGFVDFIVLAESACAKPYPTSQGGPEVKSLLQEETLGRKAHFLSLGVSAAWSLSSAWTELHGRSQLTQE